METALVGKSPSRARPYAIYAVGLLAAMSFFKRCRPDRAAVGRGQHPGRVPPQRCPARHPGQRVRPRHRSRAIPGRLGGRSGKPPDNHRPRGGGLEPGHAGDRPDSDLPPDAGLGLHVGRPGPSLSPLLPSWSPRTSAQASAIRSPCYFMPGHPRSPSPAGFYWSTSVMHLPRQLRRKRCRPASVEPCRTSPGAE